MSATASPSAEPVAVSEQEIADYLQQHPDFFLRHNDLLSDLKIPHESGQAVSLVEKQLSTLRQKNDHYQHELKRIMQVAHDNDQLAKRIHRLTLALIDAQNLDEVLNALEDELHDAFAADAVEIHLLSGDVLQQIEADESLQVLQTIYQDRVPLCGALDDKQRHFLFSTQFDDTFSAAILPLFGDSLNGLLAIGSKDASRFSPHMGTDFLQRLSEIVSKTLDVVSQPGS